MKTLRVIAVWCAVWMLGAAGCATMPGPTDEQAAANQRLADEIVRRLEEDPVTAPYAFGVMVRDGMAIMEGAISSGYVRSRAIGIARSTPGVENVLDKLAPW
ncbi:MAG: BON domain-containing protein [Kiritimatiellae bacterium]|nr:BON domain-containing protein [Kiritimatiellia bacterium]